MGNSESMEQQQACVEQEPDRVRTAEESFASQHNEGCVDLGCADPPDPPDDVHGAVSIEPLDDTGAQGSGEGSVHASLLHVQNVIHASQCCNILLEAYD